MFQITLKALANFSPRFEHSENLGLKNKSLIEPCKGSPTGLALAGLIVFRFMPPMVVLRSNHGLELANAFG